MGKASRRKRKFKDNEPNPFLDMAWIYVASRPIGGWGILIWNTGEQMLAGFRTADESYEFCDALPRLPGEGCSLVAAFPPERVAKIILDFGLAGLAMKCADGEWKIWRISREFREGAEVLHI